MIKTKINLWATALVLSFPSGMVLPVLAADPIEIIQIEDKSDYPLAQSNQAQVIGLNSQNHPTNTNFKMTVQAVGGIAENHSGAALAHATAYGVQNSGANRIETGNNVIKLIATGGSADSFASYASSYATATGIRNEVNGSIKTGNNNLTITTMGGSSTSTKPSAKTTTNTYAHGILNNGSGSVETGNNTVTITATGGSATPTNGAADIFAQAYGISNGTGAIKTGNNILTVTATSGTAVGATATSNADTRAIGIYSNGNNGMITAQGYQKIFVAATAGVVNSEVKKAYAYALFAMNDGNIILDNQSEAVQLTGDIGVHNTNRGSIEVTLNNKNAYWRPVFQDTLFNAQNGSFGSGSFTIEKGGVLDLAWSSNQNGKQFLNKHLTLTGNQINIGDGAIFIINSDLANNQADKITSSSTATGTQYVQVAYDPSIADGVYSVTGNVLVLDFAGANGQGLTTKTETPFGDYFVTVGMKGGNLISITRISETSQLGKTSSDIYRHQANILRIQNSGTLVRSMGDLLNDSTDKHYGAWARTYGGKLKSNSAYGGTSSQNYYALQAGIDWLKERGNNKYLFGLLVDQMEANSDIQHGSGDIQSTAFGGYMTWLHKNGYYANLLLKATHMDTKYHVYSDSGQRSSADFSNWGYSMNIEYGYQQSITPASYLVPHAELLLGYLEDKDYTSSDGLKIKQGSLNLAIGRLGLLYGHTFGEGNLSSAYIRGSVLHDFSGAGSVDNVYHEQRRKIDIVDDFGTSVEVNIGANIAVSPNNKLYAEVTKSVGGNVKTNFQMNLGYRYSF